MGTSRAVVATAAAGLLLAAGPGGAAPAAGITSPGAGEVRTAHEVVLLRATGDGPSELGLLAPGASTADVVAVAPEGGELAHDLDTACVTAGCASPAVAANGTWTLRLSGGLEDERTFVLRIPPAPPEEVAAELSESGVVVRWLQGEEPDLRGYRIEDAGGRIVRDRIGLDACDAERRCSAEVPEDAGGWSVRAFRATCPGCSPSLASPPSDVASTGDTGPPVAAPSRGTVAGASPSPAPSAAAAPSRQVPDQRSAFLGSFGGDRPAVRPPAPTGAPRLPALPQASGPVDQELGYAERELVLRERRPPPVRAREAVGSVLGTGERVRLLALSAVLLGAGFWLRRWTRRAVQDPETD